MILLQLTTAMLSLLKTLAYGEKSWTTDHVLVVAAPATTTAAAASAKRVVHVIQLRVVREAICRAVAA